MLSTKIKNFFIYGLGQSINLLSPLLVMPYLVKVCGETGLGKIGIAFSVSLILSGLVDYSSYLKGTKSVALHTNDKAYLSCEIAAVYTYKFLLLLGFALLGILLLLCLPNFKEKPLYFLSYFVVISQFLSPNWIWQGLQKFHWIALYNTLSKLAYIVLIYLFIRESSDYIFANFFFGIGGTVVYSFALFRLKKKYALHFGKSSLQRGIAIVKEDFNLCVSEFCLSIYQFIPILLVGYFLGNTAAGIFRIIEQVYSIFRTFIFMFFNFSYPSVCQAIQKESKAGIKTWLATHLVHLVLILVGSSFVYVFSQTILLYFKVSEQDLPYLVSLLRLAMLVPFVLVISQALRQLLFALNQIHYYTRIIYVATGMNLLSLALCLHFFELKGAFFALLGVESFVILAYLATYFYTQKTQKA